ncbi:MAG: DUF423 domain-containing protein [Pirellulales bacterium]|nr:DUF423 domain-containing protein [Pirellulales bacterium]
MSPRMMVVAGALLTGLGVGLGAFGAHGLTNLLGRLGRAENLVQRSDWFETGVKYHLFHGLAVVVIGALGVADPTRRYDAAAWALIVGIVLFSGSLYAMTLGPDAWRKLGMITPLGGLAFLLGWGLIAWRAWR